MANLHNPILKCEIGNSSGQEAAIFWSGSFLSPLSLTRELNKDGAA